MEPLTEPETEADTAPVRITALREHPRRKGRYVVEVDGVAVGAISIELIAELSLAVGRTIDVSVRARIAHGARLSACFDKALATLASRARSRADLARWLKEKEFTPAEIEPALDRLTALGLLDDHTFARGFARSRLGAARGFGPRRVAAELGRKGVARTTVDAVLSELAADEGGGDEQSAAAAVAERRVRGMKNLAPEVIQRRLYGFLVRRGFAMGIAADLARRLSRP